MQFQSMQFSCLLYVASWIVEWKQKIKSRWKDRLRVYSAVWRAATWRWIGNEWQRWIQPLLVSVGLTQPTWSAFFWLRYYDKIRHQPIHMHQNSKTTEIKHPAGASVRYLVCTSWAISFLQKLLTQSSSNKCIYNITMPCIFVQKLRDKNE